MIGLSPYEALEHFAASIYSGLRCASAGPEAGKRAPDSTLEAGIAQSGRPMFGRGGLNEKSFPNFVGGDHHRPACECRR